MMKNLLNLSLISLFSLILVACGGSSGSDDGGGQTPTRTEIDDTNGADVLSSSLLSIATFRSLKPESGDQAGAEGTISFIKSLIGNNGTSVGSADFKLKTDTTPCTISGDITDDYTEVTAGNVTTETGSTVADACVVPHDSGTGTVRLDAELNYIEEENFVTGDFSSSADGFISVASAGISGQPDTTFGVTNFEFADTGNDLTNTFNISVLAYTFEFDNGTFSFFVTIEVTDNIIESNGDSCPDSGTVVITGSNNTTVSGTFNGSSISVSINGNPVGTVLCVF